MKLEEPRTKPDRAEQRDASRARREGAGGLKPAGARATTPREADLRRGDGRFCEGLSGALTVAMALAPGVYARNKMFSLYKDPRVRAARTRAGVLRGVVRQLGSAGGAQDVAITRDQAGSVVLRYRVPAVRLERTLELTELEAACLRLLASKARIEGLEPLPGDRSQVDGALRRLARLTPELHATVDLGEP